ncbi:hypothetical protein [Escherichia albertii]|uniref:hypothetical protein n=1 Tax=Escherichia albertii TaxID=208962 RepID=UPI0039BEE06E
MRRKRLIRPTFDNACRPDKTRQRRHQALIAGCGVNALSDLRSATAVGLIRRDSVASGVDCRMQRERLIRPTLGNGCWPDKTRLRRIRRRLPDAA